MIAASPKKIIHLVPGTGNFYSGVCLRDHALVRELRRMGHDAELAPLYLPLILDHEEPNLRPLEIGGVDLYFQQHSALYRKIPRGIRQLLDSEPILKVASACMTMTRARDLGVMTVGSFQCLDGPQRKGWRHLLDSLKRGPAPDVASISLGLLSGLAKGIKEEIGCRIVVSLQGEDVFLDHLPDPWREEAWRRFAATAEFVDQFIAPSTYYADRMSERLGVNGDKMAVVPNGAGDDAFQPADAPPTQPTIGFLAQQCHGKGLDLLVDAFIELKRSGEHPQLRLKVGGSLTGGDRKFVRKQQRKIAAAGIAEDVDWRPNMSFNEKIDFLQSLSVLSVPTRYPEAFGQYAVEAMSCGVPIVQPAHGAFPELVQLAEDGAIFDPDEEGALENALNQQLQKSGQDSRLAERVRNRFTMRKVVEIVC
ncbi:MAG: glycosyltransferase family 4 protein [Verrucomicrobiota bacterium]